MRRHLADGFGEVEHGLEGGGPSVQHGRGQPQRRLQRLPDFLVILYEYSVPVAIMPCFKYCVSHPCVICALFGCQVILDSGQNLSAIEECIGWAGLWDGILRPSIPSEQSVISVRIAVSYNGVLDKENIRMDVRVHVRTLESIFIRLDSPGVY